MKSMTYVSTIFLHVLLIFGTVYLRVMWLPGRRICWLGCTVWVYCWYRSEALDILWLHWWTMLYSIFHSVTYISMFLLGCLVQSWSYIEVFTQCFYLVESWHKEAFKEIEEEECLHYIRYYMTQVMLSYKLTVRVRYFVLKIAYMFVGLALTTDDHPPNPVETYS